MTAERPTGAPPAHGDAREGAAPQPAGASVAGVPLLLHPGRLRVLCVGGGPVATGKVAALVEGAAAVRLVAPALTAALQDAAGTGALEWIPREYRQGDIGDAHLVIAATDSAATNAAVAAASDVDGRMCVRVDDAAGGTAALMGAVRRGPVVLAAATSGVAPGLSRLLREELQVHYGPEYGELAALWGRLRTDPRVADALHGLDAAARRRRWRAVYHPDILDLIRAGDLDQAKEAAYACLLSSSD